MTAGYVVVSALALCLGSLTSGSVLAILQAAFVMGALAVSFQVVFGLLGELSLGHAALFGAGAYAYPLLVRSMPPVAALLVAALIAGLIGCFVALITVRLGGVYFAVVTFALASIAAAVVAGTESLGRTEGIIGVPSIPTPAGMARTAWQFCLTGAVFAVFLLLIMLGRRTRFGSTLEMARSDRNLAVTNGIDVASLRIVVTSLSGVLAGVAGALQTESARFVSPDVFGLYYIITPLAVVAVGGLRHNLGVIPGLIVVVIVPRFLGLSPILNAVIAALLLVAAVLIFPRGIAGALQELVALLRRRRAEPGSSPDDTGRPLDETQEVRS